MRASSHVVVYGAAVVVGHTWGWLFRLCAQDPRERWKGLQMIGRRGHGKKKHDMRRVWGGGGSIVVCARISMFHRTLVRYRVVPHAFTGRWVGLTNKECVAVVLATAVVWNGERGLYL